MFFLPVIVVALGCLALPAAAADIREVVATPSWTAPDPTPVLTIPNTATAPLSRADLEKMPLRETRLETKWGLKGTFHGVLLSDVLDAVGLGAARRVRLRAADEYVITLNRDEILAGRPLLALRLDGRSLDVAEKGPLMLLWPRAADDVMAGTASTAKWIWSVVEISERR